MKPITVVALFQLAILFCAPESCLGQSGDENAVPGSQTTAAFVEALKPEPKPAAALRTRGMASAAAAAAVAAPPAAKSADLNVYFGFNSDRIAGASVQRVDNLAAALRDSQLADARFTVVGHTDAVGSTEFNHQLSQMRANAVRDYLITHGVPAGRLRAVGKGFEQLKNRDDPQADENRRVEIVAEY